MGGFNHYKALWKIKGRPKQKSWDYRCGDLKTVLRLLNKSHNVSPKTTEYLYIHLIKPDGTVQELLTHEDDSKPDHESAFDRHVKERKRHVFTDEDQEVCDTIKNIIQNNRSKHNKPRIKMTNPPTVVLCDAPITESACGLYEAQPAVR